MSRPTDHSLQYSFSYVIAISLVCDYSILEVSSCAINTVLMNECSVALFTESQTMWATLVCYCSVYEKNIVVFA